MDKDYDRYTFDNTRIEDEELFEREVAQQDDDLFLMDCLLREALAKG